MKDGEIVYNNFYLLIPKIFKSRKDWSRYTELEINYEFSLFHTFKSKSQLNVHLLEYIYYA